MAVPASVLNEIFIDKVNQEGFDSVLSLLSTFITKNLNEKFGEDKVNLENLEFTKTGYIITLSAEATIDRKRLKGSVSWTEQELLASDKAITDYIIDFLNSVFVVSTDDTSVS